MMRRMTEYRGFVIVGIAIVLLAGVYDCRAGSRMFRGKLTGRNGDPVTGAAVYIEVYREGNGVVDFGYIVTDATSAGAFSLALAWKRDVRIAYAVFARGMRTIAGFDRTRYYETHDLNFELDSSASGNRDCEARLVGMGFPFENQPSLAGRLKQADYLPLLKFFIGAYEPIINETCPVPSGYEEKLGAVKGLLPLTVP